MKKLDESSSGKIPKKEFWEAIVEISDKNKVDIDIVALTNSIYGANKNELGRKEIRNALNINSEMLQYVLAEPI